LKKLVIDYLATIGVVTIITYTPMNPKPITQNAKPGNQMANVKLIA
jgi:hypothetical protein